MNTAFLREDISYAFSSGLSVARDSSPPTSRRSHTRNSDTDESDHCGLEKSFRPLPLDLFWYENEKHPSINTIVHKYTDVFMPLMRRMI